MADDSFHELWELAEFCAREALLLRSFLEHLRLSSSSHEEKIEKLSRWKTEVGHALGEPNLASQASLVFQTIRAANPDSRKEVIRTVLEQAQTLYFEGKHGPSF